jgi:hypothetical protein
LRRIFVGAKVALSISSGALRVCDDKSAARGDRTAMAMRECGKEITKAGFCLGGALRFCHHERAARDLRR